MKVLEIYIYSVPFVNKNLLEKEKKKNMINHFILTVDVISWKDEIHFVFVLIEDVNVCFSFIMKVSIIKVLTLSLPYERVKEPGLLRP